MSAQLKLLLHRLGAEAMGLWTWWSEELLSTGSELLDLLGRRGVGRFLVRMTLEEAQFFALRGRTLVPRGTVARDTAMGRWPEVLSLPGIPARGRVLAALGPGLVLDDRLSIPKSAAGEVDRILALHLERHFPLALSAVHVARDLEKGARGKLTVHYWVARRDRVQEAEAALRRWGLEPQRLGPESRAGRIVGNWLSNQPSTGAPPLGRLDRRLLQAAGALAALVGAIALTQIGWAHFLVGRELARAEKASQVVSDALRQYERRLAPLRALASLGQRPDAADAVLALSERVPTDAWVYDAESKVAVSGAPELRLTGFAPNAAALAQRLEESPEFAGVETVGVIPRGGPSGLDRVQLTMHWQVARAASPATSTGADAAAVARAQP